MSKVLEKLVYGHIYAFCLEYELLSVRYSGFKKGDGAVNQILGMTDDIYKAFEKGSEVAVVFLDIIRAFDRVWRKGLLYKMKKMDFNNQLLAGTENYLSSRSQKVVITGQSSPILETNAGALQGSILGPLLFLIFVNDIEHQIKSDLYIFADDTTMAREYTSVSDVEQIKNAELVTISEWAHQWFVTFNTQKTVALNFSLKKIKSLPALVVNGSLIKHLGITLSDDLRWSKHVCNNVTKAFQNLGALGRQWGKLSRNKLEKMYLNMIRPFLEYGSVIFSNCFLGDAR